MQVKVLSEELETPTNVHRWRQLEGSDPKEFELPVGPTAAVSRPWGFLLWLCPAIRKGENMKKCTLDRNKPIFESCAVLCKICINV